jgi:hypothetical protein
VTDRPAASAFQAALAAEFGSLTLAEWVPRDARALGLMHARSHGRHRVWTAEDIAALVATFMLVRAQGGRFRDAGRQRLLDPEQRRHILGGVMAAMCFGHAVEFDISDGGPVTGTVRMDAGAVQRLARLVGDWGDAEAAE